MQCCVNFYYTTSWISHMYTYIPFFQSLPATPLGHRRAQSWASHVTRQFPTSYLALCTVVCICQCYSLDSSPPPLPPHAHMPRLFVCVSIPALQTATLFTVAWWKQPKCPSTDEWIKMWFMYAMEYYWAIKRSKTGSFTVMWGSLEWSQKEKEQILYINTNVCNLIFSIHSHFTVS